MKKLYFIFITIGILMFIKPVSAQNVAITDSTGYNAHSSAMLDVYSFSKGLLIPRTDTTNVSNPAKGLLVCDTSNSEVIFYFYDGSMWIDIATSGGGTDSIWVENLTDSIVYLRNDFNRLGIGIDTPLAKLDVMGDTIFNAEDTVPLFVVRDKDGKEVFVVYPKGVFIFVDTLSGSSKATTNDQPTGFRVGKKTIGSTKDFDEEYFSVLPATVADTIDPSEARVLWYPKKEAFMAGRVLVEGVDSVGTNSWASGYESKSIGNYSQALGYQAIARGHYSTAIGYDAVADGDYSFALGDSTWAGGGGGAKGTADNCYAFGKRAEATGNGSYAFGRNAYSTGNGSFALGDSTSSTKNNSFAFGRYTQALGKSSFAMGDSAIAGTDTTEYNFVFGRASKATGGNSFAFGKSSNATGDGSYAFGKSSSASNLNSFAFGFQAASSGFNAFALGNMAEATGDNSFSLGDLSRTAGDNSYSLGFFAYANGNSSYAIGDSVTAGTDSTDYAYAFGKASRAIGALSYSFGYKSVASGPNAYAFGIETSATNENSFAMGAYNISNGSSAFALGHQCQADGERSLAVGDDCITSGNSSVAMGKASEAHGRYSFAVGYTSIAYGERSSAIGSNSTALSDYSYALGYNTVADSSYSVSIGRNNHSKGKYSHAYGNSNTAYSAYETVVGNKCESYTPNSKTDWNDSDRLFVIGNGNVSYTNAMTVLKNGNVGIQISNPTSKLDICTNTAGNTSESLFNLGWSGNYWGLRIEQQHVSGSHIQYNFKQYGPGNVWDVLSFKFGNVGMGTTGPDAKLHIESPGYHLRFSRSGTGTWDFGINATNRIIAGATSGNSYFTVTANSGSNAAVEFYRPGTSYTDWRVNNAGTLNFERSEDELANVTVMYQMHSSSFRPGSDNSYTLGTSGLRWSTVYAYNGTINTSDRKEKDNIKEINYGLKEVLKLKPVSFTWKNDAKNKTKLGFIAQDVEGIIKEVVIKEAKEKAVIPEKPEADENFTYGLYYTDFIPVLVKAIQEQQFMIEQLQKENKEFRAELDKLKMQGKNIQKEEPKINSEKRNVINK